jgi:hypothetical protein
VLVGCDAAGGVDWPVETATAVDAVLRWGALEGEENGEATVLCAVLTHLKHGVSSKRSVPGRHQRRSFCVPDSSWNDQHP